MLLAGVATVERRTHDSALAAFALVHGLVMPHGSGALERSHAGEDPVDLTRRTAQVLFSFPEG